jgi:hypothetical protein
VFGVSCLVFGLGAAEFAVIPARVFVSGFEFRAADFQQVV